MQFCPPAGLGPGGGTAEAKGSGGAPPPPLSSATGAPQRSDPRGEEVQGHARFGTALQSWRRLQAGIRGRDRSRLSKPHVSAFVSEGCLASPGKGSGQPIKPRGTGRVSELVQQQQKAGVFIYR